MESFCRTVACVTLIFLKYKKAELKVNIFLCFSCSYWVMYKILIIWIAMTRENSQHKSNWTMGNLYTCVFKISGMVLYCLMNMYPVPYLEEYKKISVTNKDWGSFITDKVSNINLPDYKSDKFVMRQLNRIESTKSFRSACEKLMNVNKLSENKYQWRHITWIFIKERQYVKYKKTLLKVIYKYLSS